MAGAPGYDPPARRADAAIIGCWLAVGGAFVGVGADVRRIVLIGRYLDGDPAAALGADDVVSIATLAGLGTLAVALVLAGRWALLVARNERALGGAPAWARGPVRAALVAAVLVLAVVLVTRFGLSADSPEAVRDADWLDVAGQALLVAALAVALVAIPRVSAGQASRAAAGGVEATPRAPAEEPGGIRVVTESELRERRRDGDR